LYDSKTVAQCISVSFEGPLGTIYVRTRKRPSNEMSKDTQRRKYSGP